jgi:HEAT repeat protein
LRTVLALMKAWVVAVVGIRLLIGSALADGCFVFRWDKKTDINEPTQKAVILHDRGREDLLLQVKYEGAVEEFGWLIPVPSLPKVERGSMEAFYELSQLTQRQFGPATKSAKMVMGGADAEGRAPKVKVIETKTVGAYEVSILAAEDAGSLERWLKENGYSIPGGKSKREIVDDYIRRKWFFVAAKINLNGSGFKLASRKSQGAVTAAQTKSGVQKKLASGELHPLLISFDTPRCVFPLKISSVAGKPSEVSLYVMSEKPLLNRFIVEESCKQLQGRLSDWEKSKTSRIEGQRKNLENMRTMQLATMLYSADRVKGSRGPRGWTVEDLQATVRESEIRLPAPSLEEEYYGSSSELLHCIHVDPAGIARAAKSIPRLKNRHWFLTKFARTFAPSEMRDLEFEPAVPVMTEIMAKPIGRTAASLLAQLGTDGVLALIEGCRSSDAMVRKNAALGLQEVKDSRAAGALLPLLEDQTPVVRLHAVSAAGVNWDPLFVEPIVRLFRDPNPEIRGEATWTLQSHEAASHASKYAALATNSDMNVRMCALGVTARLNPAAVPREPLREMLKSQDPDLQHVGLMTMAQINRQDVVSRAELLEFLNSPRMDNIFVALNLINRQSRATAGDKTIGLGRDTTGSLTSSEAAALATNRFAQVRLAGVRALQRNGDARAIELTLQLLRDRNALVRNRAFAAMKAMTGAQVSDDDAAKWDKWWEVNKGTVGGRAGRQ